MNRIIDKRANGKTNQLMKWADAHNALIICKNPQQSLIVARMKGFSNVKFASYNDFILNIKDYANMNYCIDELEEFNQYYIKYYTTGKLIGYTLTNED